MNSLYNHKTNFIFTAGALLLCLSFLTFSFIPLASAITWNIDHLTVTVNNTIYWNGLSTDFLNDTFYNKSEVDNIILGNISVNLTSYVPYIGATDDLDLGSNDFVAQDGNFTRDLVVMDDLFVYDDSSFYDNVDIYGRLKVYDEISHFYGDVHIVNNSQTILEIETTNASESSELHMLGEGTNDLYFITYGPEATGNYFGLTKGNSSIIDAQGDRLMVGTFNDAPFYWVTHKNPRFILTGDGDLIPFDDDNYDIGNITNRVKDIYVTGEETSGIHFVNDDGKFGNLSMDSNLNLLWNGQIINISAIGSGNGSSFLQRVNITLSPVNAGDNFETTGNITAAYFFGDGSGLTNVPGVSDNDLHIYFNGSMYINVTYNLTAGDVNDINVQVEPGDKFIFGGTLT